MRYYLRLCIAVTRRHPVYTYTALVLLHVHIYIHQRHYVYASCISLGGLFFRVYTSTVSTEKCVTPYMYT